MKKSTREAFGETLLELGRLNDKVVALSADLQDSTKAIYFQREFPERFFNIGIAEQDLIGISAGLSSEGFIPFASSFASFIATRPYDQIRMLLCYNDLNVKIVATHSGLTVGEDGGSAQCLEDIALMMVLPNMKVFQPCDANETKALLETLIEDVGPSYIRLSRADYPIIYDENKTFTIGKGDVLAEGKDIAIIATGLMVSKALEVREILKKEGFSLQIVNMSSIKPIDRELIVKCAKKTKGVITIEEHQTIGGLGSAVLEVLSSESIPVKVIGVNDSFGQSGKAEELLSHYGLDTSSLTYTIRKFINKVKYGSEG
ncbi:transketolase family protein [uncultured Cetobacterium sp.]|uniref:transketolase family protein n=1 Tax=uncultured Cetobacterium sp. TaxID=527638 RepID=UPI00261F8E98|nr:transketolase family protein [uncultured Cetobacterium sp.]